MNALLKIVHAVTNVPINGFKKKSV